MTELKNDRSYIKTLLKIAIPMMVQNGISNFVNLLDNLMIGSIGTNAISGVGIANQLMFVFFLVIFGATAGVGIFTAQYKGKGDTEGIRYSFRFKLVFNAILSAICTLFFVLYSRHLINLFLLGEADNPADAAEALEIGVKYIHIILISLIPVGLTQAYGGTLRDLGNTKVPMFASVAAIFVNLIGNWLLIYGHFGLPAMGAEGAAIATVASRFVELAILIIYTGKHPDLFPFIKGIDQDRRNQRPVDEQSIRAEGHVLHGKRRQGVGFCNVDFLQCRLPVNVHADMGIFPRGERKEALRTSLHRRCVHMSFLGKILPLRGIVDLDRDVILNRCGK